MAQYKFWCASKALCGSIIRTAARAESSKVPVNQVQRTYVTKPMSLSQVVGLRQKHDSGNTTQRMDEVHSKKLSESKITVGKTVAECAEDKRLKNKSAPSDYTPIDIQMVYQKQLHHTAKIKEKNKSLNHSNIPNKSSSNINLKIGNGKGCAVSKEKVSKKPECNTATQVTKDVQKCVTAEPSAPSKPYCPKKSYSEFRNSLSTEDKRQSVSDSRSKIFKHWYK